MRHHANMITGLLNRAVLGCAAAIWLSACGGRSIAPKATAAPAPTPPPVSSSTPTPEETEMPNKPEDTIQPPEQPSDQVVVESAGPSSGLWVTFDVTGETFRSLATRRDTIDILLKWASGHEVGGLIPNGLVRRGGGFNHPWSWHIDPGTLSFIDIANPECSKSPSEVEHTLNSWLEAARSYCPAAARIIAIEDCRSGRCHSLPLRLTRALEPAHDEEHLNEAALAATLEALGRDIRLQVGDKSCKVTADCATIGFGAKACGGPVEYLVYSALRVNSGSLAKQVERYNKLDRRLNELRGTVSTCDYREPPQVRCRNRVCVEVP